MNRGLGTRFRHNTLSAVLLQSHPNSVWPMLMHSAREGWAAWGALSRGMQSGQVPFQVSTCAETCKASKSPVQHQHCQLCVLHVATAVGRCLLIVLLRYNRI